MRNRKLNIAFAIVVFVILAACSACGSKAASAKNEDAGAPFSRSSVGTYANDSFSAVVTSDQIKVYMVGDNSKSLYWQGSWDASEAHVTSQADKLALNASITGSQAATKDFTISGDTLEFEGSMLGSSIDVKLVKQHG